MKRSFGILLPIFSIPSKYGIGDFGKNSYKFVDFLSASGAKTWQILPLVQTGYDNSPYASVCSNSISPYYISLDFLKDAKLLTKEEVEGAKDNSDIINYGKLYFERLPLLRKAFSRFDNENKEFKAFIKKGEFTNYAIYLALKSAFNQKPFLEWDDEYKFRNKDVINKFALQNKEEILFWQFIQFEAKKEWLALKKYANSKGVKIIGDIPLYVALDSVDVWENTNLFKLDKDLNPTKVAGVPPDYFSADGQLWDNPVFDYAEHEKDNFAWWIKRVKNALSIYDYVRIDHFRGLDRFYEIASDAVNAREGEWIDVPSKELFSAIHASVDKNKIIAEDLGILDDGVIALLKHTGYPGMKVLSFAFDGNEENSYLPKNINENSVCYTGTHDNDTLKGLIFGFDRWQLDNLKAGVKNSEKLLNIKGKGSCVNSLIDRVITLGFACKSKLFILPLHDALKLDKEYRINEPGSLKAQNWSVKIDGKKINSKLSAKLSKLVKAYKR